MKPRLLIAVLLAVVVVMMAGAAFAAPPAAEGRPFKGSWDGFEVATFVPAPPPDATTMLVDLNGWGEATHLGRYTAHYEATVDLVTCGCSVGDTIQFVAANGDIVYGVGSGVGVPQDEPGLFLVTHDFRITGGTGRFADATGAFQLVRLAQINGASHGSFDGTIVLPRGN